MRARDLGIVVGTGTPGPNNAITDVAGVLVGHTTLIEGDGPLVDRAGPGPHRRDDDRSRTTAASARSRCSPAATA